MKKIITLLVMVLFSISLFANSNNESADDSKKTITVWAWAPNFNIAIMEEAKQRYTKSHPELEIEFEIVDFAKQDLEQKLHTQLASGVTKGLPDIVLVEDYSIQMYLQSYPGSFADLTGKVNHKDFAEYKLEVMTSDNKIYGIPFDSGVTGMFYRSDILADAGFTASDLENITWNEFLSIAQTVKDKTGKAMIGFDPNDGNLFRLMMNSAGQWFYGKDGEPNLANNETVKEAARIYREMANSDYIKLTAGWGDWVGAFNKGDVASAISAVWLVGNIKAEPSQAGKWAVAPIPRLGNIKSSINASNLGGSSWYVLNGSKNVDLAAQFLNETFCADVDFYQKILVDRGAVGTFLPSQSGEAYIQPDDYFGGQKVYSDFANWMTQIQRIDYGTYTYEADAAIFSVMDQIYSGGSIDDALQIAEDQLKSQLQ